jgi:hypothetical protein
MKKNTAVLAIVLSSFFVGCVKEATPVDLTGEWIGTGYRCTADTDIERVKIVHEGSNITATKITGDQCVPAGSTTFEGSFDNKTKTGNVTFTTGNPSQPSCCTLPGALILEGTVLKATISGSGEAIIFKRG